MKINNIISEDRSYLYEGLTLTESKSVKLWENAGRKLYEFALSPEQIQQLFQNIEQSTTAAGNNRTTIGQGKDVADAVNKAWTDLKSKVQNSGPVQDIDAKYDQAAAKLKQATGGDAGVMKYVQKYRDFAKKHPIAQSLIYAALIAAAGISGAGVGGAAALGLLKMTDKLLQGEKFSSAAYAGAKTGAMAYGAGQIGKALQGGEKVTSTTTTDTGVVDMPGDPALNQAMDAGQAAQQTASGFGRTTLSTFQNDPYYGKQLATAIGDKQYSPEWMQEFTKQLGRQVANPSDPRSMSQAWINASRMANSVAGNPTGPLRESRYVDRKLTVYTWALNESRGRTHGGVQLTNEGVGDMFKKAAGAVGNWAQTKGKNLTTKVTADKLQSAWKKAGSPMDSEDIAKILKDAGVSDDAVKQVYTDMKVPLPGSPKDVAPVNKSTGAPQSTPPADPAVTGPAPKPTPVDATGKPDYSGGQKGVTPTVKYDTPKPSATNKPGAQTSTSTPAPDASATATPDATQDTQPDVTDSNPGIWDKVKSFIPGTQANKNKSTMNDPVSKEMADRELTSWKTFLSQYVTGTGGQATPQVIQKAAQQFSANRYKVAGPEVLAQASKITDTKSADAFIKQAFDMAMANQQAGVNPAQDTAQNTGTQPQDQQATPTNAGANVFGQMAKDLSTTGPSSTGGQTQATPGGLKHTSNPNNPNNTAQAPATTAPATTAPATPKVRPTYGQAPATTAPAKVTGATQPGAPTPEEQAVLQQKIAAAQAGGGGTVQESVDLAEVLWRKMKRSQ